MADVYSYLDANRVIRYESVKLAVEFSQHAAGRLSDNTLVAVAGKIESFIKGTEES